MRIKELIEAAKSNPGFVFMRGISRFNSARSIIASGLRAYRYSSYKEYVCGLDVRNSLFQTLDVDAVVALLQLNGLYQGVTLPGNILSEILAFTRGATFYADRDPGKGFNIHEIERARQVLGRSFLIAQCFNVESQCPTIASLALDPKLRLIAAKYLGTIPKHVGTNLWWSYAVSATDDARNKAAQMFHYDLDDYRFIKFFFYLTEVTTESGPHVFVCGSHNHKSHARFVDRFLVRRYSDVEIVENYGNKNIKTIYGKPGDGFAEDTLGIHKGVTPCSSDRLVLQIQYAMNDYGNQNDIRDADQLHSLALDSCKQLP